MLWLWLNDVLAAVIICPLICAVLYYITHWFHPPRLDPVDELTGHPRVVLISGCVNGFGRLLTERLAKAGYMVLAGCYSKDRMSELPTAGGRIVPFHLDITDSSSVRAAADVIAAHNAGRLHALVNNAGIVDGTLIDWTPLKSYRNAMETNFFGVVALTKTALPFLIRTAHPRVVNVSSIAGVVSRAGFSAYAASKHALEAFTDSFRREHWQFGIATTTIDSGPMRTGIVGVQADIPAKLFAAAKSASPDVSRRWGGDQTFNGIRKWYGNMYRICSQEPSVTVNDMYDAVTMPHPPSRTWPGFTAKLYSFLCVLPTSAQDALHWIFFRSVFEPARQAHQQILKEEVTRIAELNKE